jgi:amino acid transporter
MQMARRPRNVGSLRAAAMLYGDWGTSKAYVTGIAFLLAGYASFYLIVGMAVLTFIVGINFIWICKYYPDGGGVYSAARHRNRTLAVIGSLLLVADYVVTASISSLDAFYYLGMEHPALWAIGSLVLIGLVNIVGPKHSGSLAIFLAVPVVIVVLALAIAVIPHLDAAHIQPLTTGPKDTWLTFVGIILALSGVEAIANMTGVMPLDPGSTEENPSVHRTARRAIIPVMLEVTVVVVILAWGMHAIPGLSGHTEDMLRYMGDYFVGDWFAKIVSVVFALLLLSAANTAIVGLVATLYSMARDQEMPPAFERLNSYGVPWIPLLVATAIPVLVLIFEHDLEALAALYAIGVIGAIVIHLGACATDWSLRIRSHERAIMLGTFVLLALVELTIAYQKHNALLFAGSVLAVGLIARTTTQRRFARAAPPPAIPERPVVDIQALLRRMARPAEAILVSVRGVTDTLRFAIEEARLRGATLYVLFVREIAIQGVAEASAEQDPTAQAIFSAARQLGEGVDIIPLYCVSDDAPSMILDQAATLGVDYLILGGSSRNRLVHLLRGSVIQEVANHLPEEIRLIIHG